MVSEQVFIHSVQIGAKIIHRRTCAFEELKMDQGKEYFQSSDEDPD